MSTDVCVLNTTLLRTLRAPENGQGCILHSDVVQQIKSSQERS